MKLISTLVLLFSYTVLLGQPKKGDIFYFNKNWQKTSKDKAEFYRVIEGYQSENKVYYSIDYFISGEKYSEGSYDWPETGFAHGTIKYYFRSGKIKKEKNFSMSKPLGKYTEWYENGDIKLNGEYIQNINEPRADNILIIHSFWSKEGEQLTKDGSGKYEEYLKTKCIYQSGPIKNGLKDGIWSGIDSLNRLEFKDQYKKGKFIKGTSRTENGNEFKYSKISTQPIVKGGVDSYYAYIKRQLETLKDQNQIKFTGKIIVRITVEEDDRLSKLDILSTNSFVLKDELLDILQNGPKWKTATSRGKKIQGTVIQPLTFH